MVFSFRYLLTINFIMLNLQYIQKGHWRLFLLWSKWRRVRAGYAHAPANEGLTKYFQEFRICETTWPFQVFWCKFLKQMSIFGTFWWFFLIFSVTVLDKDLWFFALRLMHQDASFELSKSTFGKKILIFHHKGG